jgi:RNA recognition motif-containing protein
MIDQKTGECKGYGFAMFENEEHCQVAIHELNNNGYQASLARIGQVRVTPLSPFY